MVIHSLNFLEKKMKFRIPLSNLIPAAMIVANFLFPSSAAASDPNVLQMVFVPASEKGDDSDYVELINIVSERAGIEIKPIKVTDYNAAVEAMRADRAQIAWYGGKTYIMAAEIANAEAFAAGVRVGDTNAGYYAYFVARSDSSLNSLIDIKGKTLGLNSIGSTSGDLIPRVELHKVGLDTHNENASC